MTVKQLIEKLKEFPEDMPVAVVNDFHPSYADDPDFIKVRKTVWIHSNYPYNLPDCEYINLD